MRWFSLFIIPLLLCFLQPLGKAADQESRSPDLHKAVAVESFVQLRQLLVAGTAPDQRDEKGVTPLMLAAEKGSLQLITLLLDHGADINAQNKKGTTPLMYATAAPPETASFLLSRGAAADMKRKDNFSALHFALMENKRDIFEALLRHGAEPKVTANDGETLLHLAVRHKRCSWLPFLTQELELEINRTANNGGTPLHYAVYLGHDKCAALLIDLKADIHIRDSSQNSALSIAARNGNHTLINTLLAAGAGNDENNLVQALEEAISADHHEIVKTLMDSGGNLESKGFAGRSLLQLAIWGDHIALAKYLIDQGADVNSRSRYGSTPLIMAAHWTNSPDLVQQLLEKGASVASRDNSQKTAFLEACKEDNAKMMELLLEAGANPLDRDDGGYSCLHFLALRGAGSKEFEILMAQPQSSTLVNSVNNYRSTPLHMAASSNKTELIKRLIAKGAKLDHQNQDGRTPLHEAAYEENYEAVQTLLAAAPDLILTDEMEDIPLEVAAKKGNHRCFSSILAAMVKEKQGLQRHITKSYQLSYRNMAGTMWPAVDLRKNFHISAENFIQKKNGELLENAAEKKPSDVVEKILQGYRPMPSSARDKALLQACRGGREATVQLLLEHGANPNSTDDGQSPLMLAIDHSRILTSLIEAGAHVNNQGEERQTALMLAAREGKNDAVRILLAHGADPKMKNKHGQTAYELAHYFGHGEICSLLEPYYDRPGQPPSRMRWRTTLKKPKENNSFGPFNSFSARPVVYGRLLYVASDNGSLYALDKYNGKLVWEFKAGDKIEYAPLVHQGSLYVTSINKSLYKLNPQSGQVVWKYYTDQVQVCSGPHAYKNSILFSTYNSLQMVDMETGSLQKEYSIPGSGMGIDGNLRLHGDIAYVSANDGQLVALNLKTEQRTTFKADKHISVPVFHKNVLYVVSKDQHLYSLEQETLKKRWSYDLGEAAMVPPARVGNHLYVPTRKSIIALKLISPLLQKVPLLSPVSLLWEKNVGFEVYATPAVHGQELIICEAVDPLASLAGWVQISAINRKDGTRKWSHQLPIISSIVSPVIDGELVYILNKGYSGDVFSLDLSLR